MIIIIIIIIILFDRTHDWLVAFKHLVDLLDADFLPALGDVLHKLCRRPRKPGVRRHNGPRDEYAPRHNVAAVSQGAAAGYDDVVPDPAKSRHPTTRNHRIFL